MTPKNRVVILTGATQGIGLATAYKLAEAGCKLVLAARNKETLDTIAAELGSQAIAVPTDMADTTQATTLAQKTVDAFGRIDIVINNAGVGVNDSMSKLQEKEARKVMDVNYFGPVALIQAAIPHLKNNPDGGLIINISSIIGCRAVPKMGGYCASKGALGKMAESLRLELAPDNIRVSTIYPGVTTTEFNKNTFGNDKLADEVVQGVPPEKVAQAILKTIRNERRDVFITLFDRTFVTISTVWPWLMDKLLSRYFRNEI